MPKPEPAPLVYRGLVGSVRSIVPLLTRRHFINLDKVPRTGGALVVSNHTSNYDTIALGDFLVRAGRYPRFLGKAELWRLPFIGWLARQCRQIPVERHTARAKDSLRHARVALGNGDLVAIYPEGTITKDPTGWPMLARHGAARLALATGVPVIPVAQYGPHKVLGGSRLELGKLFSLKRRDVTVLAGDPVDLSDLGITEEPTDEQLREATTRIMGTITTMYAGLRGEETPELVWDPWRHDYASRH